MFDVDAALEMFADDLEFLRESVQLFLEHCPKLLPEIREAAELGDGKVLERTSHSFKGAVSNFTNAEPFRIAQQLETMGRDTDFSQATVAFSALQNATELLVEELERFLRNSVEDSAEVTARN